MTSYYGNYKEEKHPLAARIWGHRLRIGQHWIEYMLEFLSVLSGFQYRLGQGLPAREDEAGYLETYRVPRRLGLRRFVFYDEREKNRDSRDTHAVAELRRRLSHLMPGPNGSVNDEVVEQVRSLLRSFSAIEEERSWFAKSLFPVHEEFLLWEGQRSRSVQQEYQWSIEELEPYELDRGIEFTTRNFFARGGELYYLMISAGTEGQHEQRAYIGRRLRELLTQQNQSLGKIAREIDITWCQRNGASQAYVTGTLGWILDPDCALYRQIANDLATFLNNDLDSLECLELLAHLIGFHVVCYIYHRAHPASHPEGHASGSCAYACRPTILVDLLGDQDGGVMREQSAALLREQDDLQLRQARDLVAEKLRIWADQLPLGEELDEYLDEKVKEYFQLGQTRAKGKYETALHEVRAQYRVAADRERLLQRFGDVVFEGLSGEFRKNFLGIHRKIGRAIGLIAPRKGPQVRFVLGDTLLKTLVMAMLPPGEQLPFGTFLEQLYLHYGIVVGPGEARAAELMARVRINEEYYARNRDALLERMQRAGLLTQYSDATSLVRRR
ncbi:MAG TPA: hypothetical protein VNL77_22490 [Roseiflexaceae bacterium]|nr:hypothetical protein [Roseiflexaceae bacterium]